MDVINVRGLSFKRFLDIAMPLGTVVHVVTDNDGKDSGDVEGGYSAYAGASNIFIHVGKDKDVPTLEPQLLKANGLSKLNKVFGKSFATGDDMVVWMKANKTTCALALFETGESVAMPEYIADAIA